MAIEVLCKSPRRSLLAALLDVAVGAGGLFSARRPAAHGPEACSRELADKPIRFHRAAKPWFGPAAGKACLHDLAGDDASFAVEQRQFAAWLVQSSFEVPALGTGRPHCRRILAAKSRMARDFRLPTVAHDRFRYGYQTVNDD